MKIRKSILAERFGSSFLSARISGAPESYENGRIPFSKKKSVSIVH